jgi:hypothetical protein
MVEEAKASRRKAKGMHTLLERATTGWKDPT